MSGKLIILTGFPASGKDTLMEKLLEKNQEYKKIVTYSTREPRYNEINGFHYNFVSKDRFEGFIQKEEMLEYTVAGYTYRGTHINSIQEVFSGQKVIWRIDPKRAAVVESLFTEKFSKKEAKILNENSIKIFVRAHTHKTLLNRYLKRGSEGFDVFKKRLDEEIEIFNKFRSSFPHVIVNKQGKIEEALQNLEQIISSYK